KFDFEENEVRDAVQLMNNTKRKEPLQIDEERANDIIDKSSKKYIDQISKIVPLINQMASHIPQRRKRKLHIGLFGYSRESSSVPLPRAITFCASLYSLGIPPEMFGISALDENEIDVLRGNNDTLDSDMADALRFYNEDNLSVLPEKLQQEYRRAVSNFDFETDRAHKKVTSFVLKDFKNNDIQSLGENIERAASIRKFLG
ncbi:MAG: phosphoenolpyruvate carboxylase, partial [Nanoarchaeota archaeon]|nr:phosphoenolpyruvate carboxylase [Nanoarchaeota archaeon]